MYLLVGALALSGVVAMLSYVYVGSEDKETASVIMIEEVEKPTFTNLISVVGD